MQVDFCDYAEELVGNGIILFKLEDRVMSKVKTKIWKTFSHVGLVYLSYADGEPKSWIVYMDEIYGIVSMPFKVFVSSHDLSEDRGWVYRPMGVTGNPVNFRNAIRDHLHEDSNLTITDSGSIGGSFELELMSILGMPIKTKPENTNTNIGFVTDVLTTYWRYEAINEEKTKDALSLRQVSFVDQMDDNEDIINLFTHQGTTDKDMLKSVYHLLGLVNITTYTVKPPIHVFFNPGYPDFDNKFIVKRGFVPRRLTVPTQYFRVTEQKKHVAEVIAKIFEVGLGHEDVSGHFEDELETSVLARKTRNDILKENLTDTLECVKNQLAICKRLLSKTKLDGNDKVIWNTTVEELIASYMSMASHLNHPLEIKIDQFTL